MAFSNLITLTKMPEIEIDQYIVKSNQEDIIRFYTEGGEELSPFTLEISVIDSSNSNQKIDLTRDNCDFGYYEGNNFVSLLDEKYIDYYTFQETEEGDIQQEGSVTLFYDLQRLLTELRSSFLLQDTPLYFEYKKEGKLVASKVFPLRNGVHNELAQFNISATNIEAAIGASKMSFEKDGLKIYGAGFEIWNEKPVQAYIETKDTEPLANKIYYYQENEKYIPYTLTFDEDFIYYEKIGDGEFEETQDIVPNLGKIYYKEINGEYEEVNLGFDEEKTYYEKVIEDKRNLYFEDGNLYISGTLKAATGNFTGDIHATTAKFDAGEIGGFIIEQDLLKSKVDPEGLILNGSTGTITAQKINLGTEANIENFISFSGYQPTTDKEKGSKEYYYLNEQKRYELFTGSKFEEGTTYFEKGQSYIYNPLKNNNLFIQANKISIKADGTASFGNILINGSNSEIYGDNFSITPERAEFKNIVASGSIETAVFKAATTQAVGGAMVFLPSYKVFKDEEGKIQFQEPDALWYKITEVINADQTQEKEVCKIANGSTVWLIDSNNTYKEAVVSIENKEIIIGKDVDWTSYSPVVLMNIGVINEDSNALNPIIMGVNSGYTKTANNYLYGPGLTVSEYGNTSPKLFLGDLSQLNQQYQGYGLYADTVYLNGSLTTKVGENSYAGVNTLNKVSAIAFATDYKGKTVPQEIDTSKIVFWAGADSVSDDAVQNAYFQVTEQGSIYASRAKLTNSLFVGGEIRSADIYTARIHGTGDNSSPALTIYDTSGGISFKTGYGEDNQNSGIETFSIQNNGLRVGETNFISIDNSQIIFIGDKIKTKGVTNYLSLTTKESIPVLYHEHSAAQSCGFYFDNGKTSYKLTSNKIDNTKMIWSSNDVKILGAISFAKSEADSNFQYRPVDGGYDLYVI